MTTLKNNKMLKLILFPCFFLLFCGLSFAQSDTMLNVNTFKEDLVKINNFANSEMDPIENKIIEMYLFEPKFTITDFIVNAKFTKVIDVNFDVTNILIKRINKIRGVKEVSKSDRYSIFFTIGKLFDPSLITVNVGKEIIKYISDNSNLNKKNK